LEKIKEKYKVLHVLQLKAHAFGAAALLTGTTTTIITAGLNF